jgi:hypothetical protein
MKQKLRKWMLPGLFGLAALMVICGSAAAADGKGSVTVNIPSGAFEVKDTGDGYEVKADGFGRHLVPGKPNLPARIFSIAIPPGATISGVAVETVGSALAGTYRVNAVGLPRVISDENPVVAAREKALRDANYAEVYGSDNAYPAAAAELVRPAGYRKYNLADVRVYPFAWNPQSGRLIRHESVNVTVNYTLPEDIPAGTVLVDNLARTEKIAREMIVNYNQASQWYSSTRTGGRGLYDFVIITLDTLTTAVQPLVAWEIQKGRTVNVVTTTWISTNYTGYDLAEKMRNFLRDKYPSSEWGIEDVCLIGDYDDVPMRRCEQDVGYGKPETDYYFAELSLPDNQSWDADVDRRWGENSDPIDFAAEVNVGRIPWSDVSNVTSICNKSVAYEQTNDPSFKKNMLLLGGFFWSDTDNAVLMEVKTDSGTHPWMAGWTFTKMYERNQSSYSCDYDLTNSNVRTHWGAGKYSFVNWAGHGSPTSCHVMYSKGSAFVTSGDCSVLNDDYPAIIFADACSNSDTDNLNIGQCMLRQGGVGFLGATKVAYGMPGWNDPYDGSGQSLDYFFTTNVTSGDYSQGGAHRTALRKMYTSGLWYYVNYEMFEWGALWGSPDLGLKDIAAITLSFSSDLPGSTRPPGIEADVVVSIRNGLENYVPGSGRLFYRYDGGTFIDVALSDLGGDLYGATMPVTRPGDTPEFYFQAEGSGSTIVTSPFGAPASVYSHDVAFVETIFADNFETNTGWTVQDFNISTGTWERCVPNLTSGGQVAPTEDNPAGTGTYCYVTANGPPGGTYSDYDIDGGPTVLTSPVIDLSSGDAFINCYIFYSTRDGDDPFKVDVSNNAGQSWTNVYSTNGSTGGWTPFIFKVGDYVSPTANVQVRFSAQDQPNNDIVEAGLDDFNVERIITNPALWAGAYSFSAPSGCNIPILIDAGSTYGSRAYKIVGGLSGSSPGTPLPGGKTLPVNWDWMTSFILANPSSPVFVNFAGNLDGQGEAVGAFVLAGPGATAFVGQTITFAFALTGTFDFVSNPMYIEIEP